MIKTILFFSAYFLLVCKPTTACDLCIVNATCDDDYIHFNIAISSACPRRTKAYFSYQTDINPEKFYLNQTFDCRDCQFDLTIDPIRDAWVYTLTVESPKPTALCSHYKATCGGKTSRYVWIITGSLSGLFMLFGIVLCTIRLCRAPGIQSKEVT